VTDDFDRFRDRLPVNPPYDGWLAAAYDAWIPVESLLEDEATYLDLLAGVHGPVLELGCGAGRPLLRWRAAGMAVEGLDASADMLALLRQHAAEQGVDATVHHGDFAPLALGRTYAAIVCPAGTVGFLDGDGALRAAAESWLAHLEPGGLLAVTVAYPGPPRATFTWRLRRSGTGPDGTTYLVHEANGVTDDGRFEVIYDRLERYDADGREIDRHVRRYRLRLWDPDELGAELTAAGFVAVDPVRGDFQWVATARRARP
jgi:SAM-dependent methyltransferase